MRAREHFHIGIYDWQTLLGLIRMFVFGLGLIIAFGVFGSIQLDGVNPNEVAAQYRQSLWFLQYTSEPVLVLFAAIVNPSSLRYMIAPFSAIACVIIAGAFYVQDIYALPGFNLALRYVMASMFGMNYPAIVIDKGEKQTGKQTNLVEKIGGPGFVVIEPGNAAMFRRLREPSKASVSRTYFLEPFETIAQVVNLDEQQDMKEKLSAMTRDGIRVVLRDIHFRYRIRQEEQNGVPVKRSLSNPYPFSGEAIRNMTFNLQVDANGLESWRSAVERMVTGVIADYVSEHTIDFLTAPRTNEYNPRLELRQQFFLASMRKRLSNLGAELLWVDVGHVEIEDDSVDELRTNLWSADWAGDANEVRAYGDAIREAYQELGRAEAQADLIMSIAGALSDTRLGNNSAANVRKILLARTAQLLKSLNEDNKPSPGEKA